MATSSDKFKTVRAQNLIDIGMPRAVLWNTNLSKEVDSQAFIVSTLIKAYNDFVIEKLVAYFGTDIVFESLNTYRDRVSEKLKNHVHIYINDRYLSA